MLHGESISDVDVKENPHHLTATEKGGVLGEVARNVSGSYIPPRAKSLDQLIRYSTVEDLLANHGNIHQVLDSDTIETTLQCFKNNNIQSAPVYSSANKSTFLGLVDTAGKEQLETHFFNAPISDLIEISKFNPTTMVPVGTSLIEVLRILEKGEVHRVGIPDPNSGALFNIVSQMSILQYVARNISMMDKELCNKPVSEFMKKIIEVENIPSDTKTFVAFEYLFKGNISGAAIVNLAGMVVDTLSTSDVVGFLYDRFKHVEDDITTFLANTRRTKSLKPPIVCTLNDTLEYAILKLASTRVHRLWVVEEDSSRYLGLVNLTNILHALAMEFDENT